MSIFSVIGKIAKTVAPILGAIPGIGTIGGAVIGGLGGLASGDGLGGALTGALGGASGGLLGKIGGSALSAITSHGGGSSSAPSSGGYTYDANGNISGIQGLTTDQISNADSGSGSSNGGVLGSIGSTLGSLGLTGSDILKGVGTGLDYAAGRSDTAFNQGLSTQQLALQDKLGTGQLGVSQASQAETARENASRDALASKTEADTTGLNTELGRQSALSDQEKLAEGQRQFDTTTGTAKEATDYGRAMTNKLAQVRSKYVTQLQQPVAVRAATKFGGTGEGAPAPTLGAI